MSSLLLLYLGPVLLITVGIPGLLYVIKLFRSGLSSNRYIPLPGPTQFPIVGRVHDLPLEYTWLKFKEWADKYGPIYRTSMMGLDLVIISDEKIAEDLLVKRAKIYSDRPAMKSVVDSKSTHGSMGYLPLMGKNSMRKTQVDINISVLTCQCRILGTSAQMGSCSVNALSESGL